MPWKTVQRFPGLNAAKLKERHEAAVRKIGKELRWIPEGEILDQWQETHRRWCEHQEREGRFRFDAASGRYLMTQSTGLRGIANFVNPFSGLFAVCGAAAGVAFPQRHYAWALLLALVPATLLPLPSQAFAVAWTLIVAHWGARWQNSRRRLL